MKKKLYIIIFLCFVLCSTIHSQEVSYELAHKVAENFFHSHSSSKSQIQIKAHYLGNKEKPTMYAFSMLDNWVLVAGDKRVRPIMAYSDEQGGSFPEKEDRPHAMNELLEWYDLQIEQLRMSNNNRDIHPQWQLFNADIFENSDGGRTIVGPLLVRDGNMNKWNQYGNNSSGVPPDDDKCYNKFCPPKPDSAPTCAHSLVGCMPLSMAQIIWYWKWPYSTIVNDDHGNQILREYDWNNMPYQLLNESSLREADMIANLLHDVGVAIAIAYTCTLTGSSTPLDISLALQDTFRYCVPDIYLLRQDFSDSIWIAMIKSDLNLLRPILYAGFRNSSGHRFVIDGYNSSGLFHMNYGWGGTSNGYYSLDSIASNYNNRQSMIKGIYPNYPSCTPIIIPSSEIWPTTFTIQNGGAITIGDRTINSGEHGSILSGESVILTSNFKVETGAEIYVDVKDMHCGEERANVPSLHVTHNNPYSIQNTPNIQGAHKVFREGQIYIILGDNVYNICGTRIK